MKQRHLVVDAMLLTVADQLRDDLDVGVYLRRQMRAMDDMLAGRPVRPWRLERLEVLVDGDHG